MHTFSGLASITVTEWARSCASQTPTLHVITGGKVSLLSILTDGRLLRESPAKKDATASSEEEGELGPSVYFFAGRCYPAPVGAAVFLAREDVTYNTGEATPFDTGGVIKGYTKLPWNMIPPKTKAAYIQSHTQPTGDFRTYLERHLAAFFDSPGHYWSASPARPIDGHDFEDSDDYRDWTFEVRSHEDVPIDGMDLFVTPGVNSVIAELERRGDAVLPATLTTSDVPAEEAENHAQRLGCGGGGS